MESVTCVDMISNMESDEAREERLRRKTMIHFEEKEKAELEGSFLVCLCVTMHVHFL